jgi:hypothetical protein
MGSQGTYVTEQSSKHGNKDCLLTSALSRLQQYSVEEIHQVQSLHVRKISLLPFS